MISSHRLHRRSEYLKILLGQLEEYGVVINPAKCVFSQEEVKFVSYLVSRAGIRPLPDRVKAILEYQKPETTRLAQVSRHVKFLQEIFIGHHGNLGTDQRIPAGQCTRKNTTLLELAMTTNNIVVIASSRSVRDKFGQSHSSRASKNQCRARLVHGCV